MSRRAVFVTDREIASLGAETGDTVVVELDHPTAPLLVVRGFGSDRVSDVVAASRWLRSVGDVEGRAAADVLHEIGAKGRAPFTVIDGGLAHV